MDVLKLEFPGSIHVSTVGLATATDREIWDFAAGNGFTIVSKDADFHHMSFLYGAPPKTVWIRLGNCTTAKLVSFLTRKSETMRVFLNDGKPPCWSSTKTDLRAGDSLLCARMEHQETVGRNLASATIPITMNPTSTMPWAMAKGGSLPIGA